jgi:6-phosphogluconolactonase
MKKPPQKPSTNDPKSTLASLQSILKENDANILDTRSLKVASLSIQNFAPAATAIIKKIINDAIDNKGKAVISLNGGRAIKEVFILLRDTDINWSKVHIFWGDERPPRPDIGLTNYESAYEYFLQFIHIPPENIHRLRLDLDDHKRVARKYAEDIERTIGKNGKFDLMLVGGGGKGQMKWHTMGIMPHSEVFNENPYLVGVISRMDTGYGYTTTPDILINKASFVIGLFPTEEKNYVLTKLIKESKDYVEDYPVTLLKKRAPNTTFVLTDQPLENILL